MPLSVPRASDDPPSNELALLFRRVNADWARERRGALRPPELCLSPADRLRRQTSARQQKQPPPQFAPGDRWLAEEYPQMLLDFAQDLGLAGDQLAALRHKIAEASLTSAEAAPKTAVLVEVLRRNRPPDIAVMAPQEVPSDAGPITRRNARAYILDYLAPLVPRQAYESWLDQLAANQILWRGARPGSPAVPATVFGRERMRDEQLVLQWVGRPPAEPPPGATAAARRRYQRELLAYERRRVQVQAFVQSEPTAPSLSPPAAFTERETARLERQRAAAASAPFPVLAFPAGVPRSANLFISEVAAVAGPYLDLLADPLRVADPGGSLTRGLLGLAYGALALALVPLYCVYDNYHGTGAIEDLVPRLNSSTAALRTFTGRRLSELFAPTLVGTDEPAIGRILDVFATWLTRLADAIDRAHLRLLGIAAEQGGGRVYLPRSFAGGWSFVIAAGEGEDDDELRLRVAESVAYDTQDREREIFWLLPSLWTPLATAVALVNQAGMRLFLNAGNNRWGGRHPPHRTHRQGGSVDADVGMSWLDVKVPDVKMRDNNNLPLSDRDAPKNATRPDCLEGMDRVAGWILVQAFIIVGIDYYLYGDRGIVVEAARHLEQLGTRAPLLMDGRTDAKTHYNHWHFEMSLGQRTAGPDPYRWQVADRALLDTLYRLASMRDEDPTFWATMAGLTEPPTEVSDFGTVADPRQRMNWQRWWTWRSTPAGIPLLPVWSAAAAGDTLGPDQCMDARDMPVPGLTDEALG